MNTSATLNTFLFINHTNSVLVIGNGIYRANFLARTLEMGNRAIRTCLSTFATFFTFSWINMRTTIANGNSTKITGILTCFAHTVSTVIRHYIRCNGTLFTSRLDHLYHIHRVHSHWAFPFCQTNPLFNDLPLFIDTAAKLSLRTWEHLIGKLLPLLL